jgi:hypothetical protein
MHPHVERLPALLPPTLFIDYVNDLYEFDGGQSLFDFIVSPFRKGINNLYGVCFLLFDGGQ